MATGHNAQAVKGNTNDAERDHHILRIVPYRADKRCISNPSTVDTNSTHSSLYWAALPLSRSDSMLPGSRNAIDIRKPGPVNAHSLRKLKPSPSVSGMRTRSSAKYVSNGWLSPFVIRSSGSVALSSLFRLCTRPVCCSCEAILFKQQANCMTNHSRCISNRSSDQSWCDAAHQQQLYRRST